MSKTVQEEIDEWIDKYEKSDIVSKYLYQQIAALDKFKADQIWEYVKTQETISNKEMLEALEKERKENEERRRRIGEF